MLPSVGLAVHSAPSSLNRIDASAVPSATPPSPRSLVALKVSAPGTRTRRSPPLAGSLPLSTMNSRTWRGSSLAISAAVLIVRPVFSSRRFLQISRHRVYASVALFGAAAFSGS